MDWLLPSPSATVALGVDALGWLLGFYIGALMSERMDDFLFGDGQSLRAAIVTVRPIYYFVMLSIVATIVSLIIVEVHGSNLKEYVQPITSVTLFIFLGALYICDVQTRILPEFFTVPIILLGLFHAMSQPAPGLQDAVAGGATVVLVRYIYGLGWNVFIVMKNAPLARLEFVALGNGDFFLGAACAIWIGFYMLGYFLLVIAATGIMIALLYRFAPEYLAWSSRRILLPKLIRTPDIEVPQQINDPRYFPFGTVIIISFILMLAYKTTFFI